MPNNTDFEKELMFEYGEEKAEKMLSYLDKVIERNEHINLTAIKDRDEALQKHLADSLAITGIDEYLAAKNIIDIGTGAGFPGAIIAIASPEKNFVLLDSTLKRLKVIDEFAADLNINNITTLHARAEEIARKPEYAAKFDVCVSRAVANLTTLSNWCMPFVKKGGFFIAYKGENYKEELDAASPALSKLGGKVKKIVNIPEKYQEISGHVLIIIEKL